MSHLNPKSIGLTSESSGLFARFAKRVASLTGSPGTFAVASAVILVWGISGPLFHFSDTWQLAINTSTTIVTFLMVFLIQNTQNRDGHAIQLKLDELLRAIDTAHTAMIDIEELSEKELARIRSCYVEIAKKGRENLRRGKVDTGVPHTKPLW